MQEQLEMDRWLSVLSRSCSGHDVATVALARSGRNASESCLGRLAALGGEVAAVLALDPPPSTKARATRRYVRHPAPNRTLLIEP